MAAVAGGHARRVLSSLNQQRAAGRFCDAVLDVGDGAPRLAHRCLLACFSELFGRSGAAPEPDLDLQGCPGAGLELLLNFVYTGELKLDADNLDTVQRAASSLRVPEALALCQRFREKSAPPLVSKGKRGRPRKSASDEKPLKEESSAPAAEDESGLDAVATTTRSGRVVKGPRRLLAADGSPAANGRRTPLTKAAEDGLNPDRPAAETEVDTLDNGVLQASGDSAAEEGDEGPDGEDAAGDTDDEYLPPAESSSSAPPAAPNLTVPSKANKRPRNDGAADDPNKDSVQCPTCHKSFKSKYYLKVHNRRHTGERPFGCLKCGKRYFRKENLFLHETRDCARVQTYTCRTCSEAFGTKEELRLHMVSHTGEMPHKCSTCSEQFMYKKNLTMHMMKVHCHPKPHACPLCPKTFLTRTEMRVHEAAKHRGEKPFVCEECGHRASSRNGLQMHIKAIHRNERPFVCNVCGHAFSQKNNLNMHLRVHSGERPFQCHLCGKTFRTQASLDKHQRTHTGERPFGCDVCEQRFTEKGALLRHKASKHEEGRPHCCHICGKTFKAKEQLRVHLRRHRGTRNFECIDCGYKFTRQAHLRRHMQIHKRTENYNPRQRKLRNIVVQDVDDGGGAEDEGAKPASPAPGTVSPASGTVSPASGSVMRVAIQPAGAGTEEGASETFSVPEELQQTELVGEAYQSTIDME
ncbi:uncharacterized protein zbtb48 [Menidia menidia]